MNMNKKYIIGIITVPLSPGRKYYKVCGDAYIASSHINWLKRSGLNVIAIPYNTNNHQMYFNSINGLYLPSGGAFASTQKDYYKSCKKFLKLAIEANNKNNYFPIWGGCMGMQQMMIMADGFDNLDLLEKFDSFNNLMLPLKFTKTGLNNSKMCKYILDKNPKKMNYLMHKKCTLNNHMLGLSPTKFKKCCILNRFYRIVTTNFDRKGKEFVSTIEAIDYPFYGVQWHPERSEDMDFLAEFLFSEVKKNKHRFNLEDKYLLQFKKINCMTYSDNLYKYCNFYWHKKTSEHNKNLCNILNLGKPTNNSV